MSLSIITRKSFAIFERSYLKSGCCPMAGFCLCLAGILCYLSSLSLTWLFMLTLGSLQSRISVPGDSGLIEDIILFGFYFI